MNRKITLLILNLSLLLCAQQTRAMDMQKYLLPIGLVATSFAIFLFIKTHSQNVDKINAKLINDSSTNTPRENSVNTPVEKTKVSKQPTNTIPRTDLCCSLKNIPILEDYYTFYNRQQKTVEPHVRCHTYLRILYKQCKKVLNSSTVCDNCRDRFLISLKKQFSYFIREPLFNYHTRIITLACLLGCKFNDFHLISIFIHRLSTAGMYFGLDAAALFGHTNIITQLIDSCTFEEQHITELPRTSLQEIIGKNLKGGKHGLDLVANFFETMLHRAKTEQDKIAITELLDNTLKDNIDDQLDLLFIVIKHRYALLEHTLKKRFGLTLESKNSKNQTLFHRTYLLHHTFDHISRQNPESLVSVIKRLIDENVKGINDQDSDGNTSLHYAIKLYRRLCLMNNSSAHAHDNIKHGTKKFGLWLLLTHPSIDLTAKDKKGEPLIWYFFEYSLYLIKHILTNKNFDPYQVSYDNRNFLNKFFMEIATRYPAKKSFDLTRFKNKEAITTELRLLPTCYKKDSGIRYYTYETLESLTYFYLTCDGSLTHVDKKQPAAINIARNEYNNSQETYLALLQQNTHVDPTTYTWPQKDPRVTAKTTMDTKEIIYHIYLVNSIPSSSYTVYRLFLLMNRIPKELTQRITKFYFVTIDSGIDRTIASKVKENFENIKREKYNYYHPSKDSTRTEMTHQQVSREDARIEYLELDYYRKTQDEKMEYRQEVLQQMIAYQPS